MTRDALDYDAGAGVEGERTDLKFKIGAEWIGNPAENSEITIQGNFSAPGSKDKDEVAAAWAEGIPLSFKDGIWSGNIPDLEVGQRYQYKLKIVQNPGESGEMESVWPRSGTRPLDVKKISEAKKAKSTPSAALVQEQQQLVGSKLLAVLKSGKTVDRAKGIPALMAAFEKQLSKFSEGDREKVAISMMRQFFTTSREVPSQIREAVMMSEPATFDELKTALEVGIKEFKEEVLLTLRADPAAREALGIQDDDEKLTSAKMQSIFDRVLSGYTFENTISFVGLAVQQSKLRKGPDDAGDSDTEGLEKLLTNQRQQLVADVTKRLGADKKGKLGKMPETKKRKLIDNLIDGGLVAMLFAGGIVPAGAAWAAKGAFEGVTGTRVSDIITAKTSDHSDAEMQEVWHELRDNNIAKRWWSTKQTIGDLTAEGMKRSVPFIGERLAKSKHKTNGGAEAAAHVDKNAKAERSIDAACRKVISEGARTARTADFKFKPTKTDDDYSIAA